MIRNLLILLLPLVLLTQGALCNPSTITELRLRATVRVAHDAQVVHLGDIAHTEGPQAEALRAIVIDPGVKLEPGVWSLIDPEMIREQLKSSNAINYGAIEMRGGEIRVTRLPVRNATPKRAQSTDNKAVTSEGPILREHIERWVYARLRSTPERTRIKFDERDADLLATPTDGRIVEVREIGRSDRMTLGLVIYEHERIVLENTIRFEALVEREVLVSTGFIRRGERISDETTRREKRWLATTEPIAEPDSALGQITRSTIDPGEMLLGSMLEAPILVQRGQIVSARSVAGSVSVSLKVRAKQSGRLGEIIELESRDRTQHFHARVAGSGRVVIVHDREQHTANAASAGR